MKYRLYEYNGFTGGWRFVIDSDNRTVLRTVAEKTLEREWEIRELKEVKIEKGDASRKKEV